MSFRMVNWAYEQDLPPSPKFLLVTLADKADDNGTTAAGVDFLAYETGISTRTVIRHLKQLEEMNLLHKERREYKGFGGRKTNLTILHPWVVGTKPKWHDYKKLQREAEKTKREFGVTSPVENFESVQGDNLALSSNSGADTQHDNMSHSVHKVTYVHTQGDKSCNFSEVALKERAHGFNHQLINHQSVKSPGPVENSGLTDGSAERKNSNPSQQVPSASVVCVPTPVQHNPQRQGQPAPASVGGTTAAVAARCDSEPMVQGVALRQLAVDLVSDGVPAPAVKAVVQAQGLARMVEVAMSRSQQVRSPQRYCRAVLAREWEQLVSQCAPAAYPLCARHRVRLSSAGQCRECVQESREAAEEASHSRGVNMRQVRQLAQERGLNLENIRNLELGPVVEGLISDGIVAAEVEQVACFLADNPEIVSNLEQKRTA